MRPEIELEWGIEIGAIIAKLPAGKQSGEAIQIEIQVKSCGSGMRADASDTDGAAPQGDIDFALRQKSGSDL